MIVCSTCGFRNPGGELFCASCRSFLEFTGVRDEEEVSAAPWAPPHAPARAGAWAPPDPGAAGTAARPPTAEVQAPTTRRGPTGPRWPHEEGPACSVCGLTNGADRRFCRRCASPLFAAAPTAAAPRVPWWRRLFSGGDRRGRPSAEAAAPASSQEVRQVRKRRRVLRRWIAAGLALVVLAFATLPQLAGVRQGLLDRGRDLLAGAQEALDPELARVAPDAVEASSALEGHPATDAFDGFANTWWAEGAPGPGIGEELRLHFPEPVRLRQAVLTIGGVEAGGSFFAQPRPRRLVFEAEGAPGQVVEIADEPEPQTLELELPVLTRLVIRLEAVHPPIGSGSDTPIAEIELVRIVGRNEGAPTPTGPSGPTVPAGPTAASGPGGPTSPGGATAAGGATAPATPPGLPVGPTGPTRR